MTDNTSSPQPSRYMRNKIRKRLVASGTWITTYQPMVQPYTLCPPNRRIATRTTITYNQALPCYSVLRICHKCISRLHLRRELEHPLKQ